MCDSFNMCCLASTCRLFLCKKMLWRSWVSSRSECAARSVFELFYMELFVDLYENLPRNECESPSSMCTVSLLPTFSFLSLQKIVCATLLLLYCVCSKSFIVVSLIKLLLKFGRKIWQQMCFPNKKVCCCFLFLVYFIQENILWRVYVHYWTEFAVM